MWRLQKHVSVHWSICLYIGLSFGSYLMALWCFCFLATYGCGCMAVWLATYMAVDPALFLLQYQGSFWAAARRGHWTLVPSHTRNAPGRRKRKLLFKTMLWLQSGAFVIYKKRNFCFHNSLIFVFIIPYFFSILVARQFFIIYSLFFILYEKCMSDRTTLSLAPTFGYKEYCIPKSQLLTFGQWEQCAMVHHVRVIAPFFFFHAPPRCS